MMFEPYDSITAHLMTQPQNMDELYHSALARAKNNHQHSPTYNSLLKALFFEALVDGIAIGLTASAADRNNILKGA